MRAGLEGILWEGLLNSGMPAAKVPTEPRCPASCKPKSWAWGGAGVKGRKSVAGS